MNKNSGTKGFANSLIELKLASNRLVEGKVGLFSVKFQVLYIIASNEMTSPSELIFQLNMAKSNLALIAKKMISEGLITSVKVEGNKKQIYYKITEKGRAQLDEKIKMIDSQYSADNQILNRLAKTIEALKKMK